MDLRSKLKYAANQDPSIFIDKSDVSTTFGNNPDYLKDIFSITKSDLIRLERVGLAVKARYVVEKTGEHRVRWILYKEALNDF